MKTWSRENESAMYKKRLQKKYTFKDYWFMWSMERMDTDVLHDRETQIISQITSNKYHFSFNFGSIRKDSKQFNSSTSKWNKALSIEVKREEKETVYNLMGRIF